MTEIAHAPEGWHPDPLGRFNQRWWDGVQWTSHVSSSEGQSEVDPLPIATESNGLAQSTTVVSNPNPQVHSPAGWNAMPVQTPGYGLPGGGAWAAPQQIAVANVSKSPGLAVAALVLGIGAFFFSLIPIFGFLSIPFAICGLALGIAGIARANKGYEGKGLSIAGVVASLAALLVSFVYMFAVGDAVNDLDGGVNSDPIDYFCNYERYVQDPDCG